MKETQMLKGVLEGCVLQVIAQEEIYGYELVQRLKQSGFENMVAGTVYPLLQKMEKKGFIQSQMKASPAGPDRKYFAITNRGQEELTDFWQEWGSLVIKVNKIKEKYKI